MKTDNYAAAAQFERPPHRHRDKAADDAAHLLACKRWLITEGITAEGMPRREQMAAMTAYRERICCEEIDPLDWARRILMRLADGEFILPIQERLAKSAMRMAS